MCVLFVCLILAGFVFVDGFRLRLICVYFASSGSVCLSECFEGDLFFDDGNLVCKMYICMCCIDGFCLSNCCRVCLIVAEFVWLFVCVYIYIYGNLCVLHQRVLFICLIVAEFFWLFVYFF